MSTDKLYELVNPKKKRLSAMEKYDLKHGIPTRVEDMPIEKLDIPGMERGKYMAEKLKIC